MLSGLTRAQWLAGISQGVDLLTAAHFPNRETASHLESMGALGGTTGYVGKPGVNSTTHAPVFEVRSMTNPLSYYAWMNRATDIFRYVLDVNNCSGEYYRDSVSVFIGENKATIEEGDPQAIELLLQKEAKRVETELHERLK